MGKIKIKNVVTFEDYQFDALENDIRIIGVGKCNLQKNLEYNCDTCIKDTYKLGKFINETIEKYFTDKHKVISFVNLQDRKEINKRILGIIENAMNNNFDYFYYLLDFYEKSYNLFRDKKIPEIVEMTTPDILENLIYESDRNKLGIFTINNDISVKEHKIYLIYKFLLKILKKYEKEFDYVDLSNTLPYMPMTIKNFLTIPFFEQNEYYSLIQDKIKKYCLKYGMPFWTDRAEISDLVNNKYTYPISQENIILKNPEQNTSKYDITNNCIPIYNLLFISLLIYLLQNIYDKVINSKNSYFDINFDEYKYGLGLLGIHLEIYNSKKEAIDLLINNIQLLDDFIISNCNCIYNFPLKIFRNKVAYKTKKKTLFYNENIYESFIISVWDNFYLNHIGNSNVSNPTPLCIKCKKEADIIHKLRDKKILCDSCYKEHKKELNRLRVSNHRKGPDN